MTTPPSVLVVSTATADRRIRRVDSLAIDKLPKVARDRHFTGGATEAVIA